MDKDEYNKKVMEMKIYVPCLENLIKQTESNPAQKDQLEKLTKLRQIATNATNE